MTTDRAIYTVANALDLPIADESVHMIATSPPYFGLRSYDTGDMKHAELGAEKLHDCLGWATGESCGACYVCHMRQWAREMWRVLRSDGVMFLNLADSYAANRQVPPSKWQSLEFRDSNAGKVPTGLKPKDLCGIPQRVVLALQADGWYWRSKITWCKTVPMPESVRDRPTNATEEIFLLTKQPRYFWDSEAVKEPQTQSTIDRSAYKWNGGTDDGSNGARTGSTFKRMAQSEDPIATIPADGRRNLWNYWIIGPSPFNGAKLSADYVGADGKPYIASKDCPIHSPLYYKRNPRMVSRDEQPGLIRSHNGGNDRNLSQELSFSSSANFPHDSSEHRLANPDSPLPENSRWRILGSTGDNKKQAWYLTGRDSNGGAETQCRTNHKSGLGVFLDESRGLIHRRYSDFARGHNTSSNKTGHALETNRLDTVCAQTSDDTGYTQGLRENSEPSVHTQASNTEAAYPSEVHVLSPSVQTIFHNAYTQTGLPLNLPNESECTCIIAQVDHYATWPPALVERMIKAGTSERGVCPHCGTPWRRVVERGVSSWERRKSDGAPMRYGTDSPAQYTGFTDAGDRAAGGLGVPATVTTTGWQPTCNHNAAPVPAIVLDPFCGSGTTLMVARQLGRIGLGFDLSERYLYENARTRLGHDQLEAWGKGIPASANGYHGLPLFARVNGNGNGVSHE
jgi:DNA modification methylase